MCLAGQALSDLMGESGRRHSIFDPSDMPCDRPDGWQTWAPWTADVPGPWAGYVLARCRPLAVAVGAIRAVRAELRVHCRASEALRENVRAYLEGGVLGGPWLAQIEIDAEATWAGTRKDGERFPVDEVVLVTAPASAAMLNRLSDLAERVVLDAERRGRGGRDPRGRGSRGRRPRARTAPCRTRTNRSLRPSTAGH